ncbi:alpha/beta-gliadin MM1-like [Eutrema salsugineum]|uniref:alpha/beta-gliadin MM1-like n=1 Tax=Eutrema salsugineum TaxID=72664 RepID=UPI000CED558D|nr:alpha/beta-gliadin MM1-like [Eutrema salsugineum]
MGGRGGRKRGRGRGGVAPSQARSSSPLPGRYDFTPSPSPPVVPTQQPSVSVRDYPPPAQLFPNSQNPHRGPESRSHEQPSPHGQQQPSPRGQQQPVSQQQHEQASDAQSVFPEEEEEALFSVNLAEDQQRILNALLTQPGREAYTTVLSPIKKPNTT